MLAVNYSNYRSKLKDYCDKATDDNETVIITRKNEKNLVMMSLDEYNNLLENLFIRSNKANYQHILEGISQLNAGKATLKTTEDLENLINE